MKSMFLALTILGFMLPSPALAEDGTAKSILDRHLAAIGGKDAVAKVQALRIQLNVSFGGANSAYNAMGPITATMDWQRPHLLKNVSVMGGQTFASGYNGQRGWRYDLNGTHIMTDQEISQLLGGLHFQTWESLTELGFKAEYQGEAQVEGRKAHHLNISRGPYAYDRWFDAETGLLLKSSDFAGTSFFGAPTKVDGVLIEIPERVFGDNGMEMILELVDAVFQESFPLEHFAPPTQASMPGAYAPPSGSPPPQEPCRLCQNSGIRTCYGCGGDGMVQGQICSSCSGAGSVACEMH